MNGNLTRIHVLPRNGGKEGVFGQRLGKWDIAGNEGDQMLIFPALSWFLGRIFADRKVSIILFFGKIFLLGSVINKAKQPIELFMEGVK